MLGGLGWWHGSYFHRYEHIYRNTVKKILQYLLWFLQNISIGHVFNMLVICGFNIWYPPEIHLNHKPGEIVFHISFIYSSHVLKFGWRHLGIFNIYIKSMLIIDARVANYDNTIKIECFSYHRLNTFRESRWKIRFANRHAIEKGCFVSMVCSWLSLWTSWSLRIRFRYWMKI